MPKVSQKHKDLGIFYTPPEVVEFIYEILKILKNKDAEESKRWQFKKPRPHYPSVLDPACGEGIFLKKAIKSKFTGYHPRYKAPYIFGIDIDERVVDDWKERSISKLFNGDEVMMKKHFFGQNGLLDLPDHNLPYKKAEDGLFRFDAVVGNPPYGGVGLGETELTNRLIAKLAKYEILPKLIKNNLIIADTQSSLFRYDKKTAIKPDAKQRLKSFPIEVLFLNRFIQLAKEPQGNKSGGWIAIIIPDGILANSQLDYVRKFVADKTKVEAIVSLPRGTFKQAGTNAKTSILFLTKGKPKDQNYPVFLASIEKINSDIFNKIVKYYQEFIMKQTFSKDQKVFNDEKMGIMVRVDKALKEMIEEKPASRWDPNFWGPIYDSTLEKIRKDQKVSTLGHYITYITYGVITTGAKRGFDSKGKIWHINQINVRNTGLDIYLDERKISESDERNSDRARPKDGDILFNRDQLGTMGRCFVFHLDPNKFVVNDHVNIIRFNGINPHYVAVYLLSKFGNLQVDRFGVGVSGIVGITFDQIKAIKILVLPDSIQKHIESEYKKMTAFHDGAMEAKKKGDEAGYKKNIEIAEKMLKDLIKKTEEVIEGKRKDVI